MNSNLRRREFLKRGGTLLAGATLASFVDVHVAVADPVKSSLPAAANLGWLVGVESYTFRRFSLYEALDMITALGIQYIEPVFDHVLDKARRQLMANEDLPSSVRKELKAKLADRGIAMSTFYGDLSTDQDRARKIFDFCKEMGTGTIVAEPPAAAFDMIENLCEEYHINVAIHNHPESPDSLYWKPENVLAVCKGRGNRIGACCDTGHWLRSGLDPVECLKKLEGRILGFHLKDLAGKSNPDSRDVPLGEGKANCTAVLKELKHQGYRGTMAIEYEYDSPELKADVAKCIAFVEKTAQTLGG